MPSIKLMGMCQCRNRIGLVHFLNNWGRASARSVSDWPSTNDGGCASAVTASAWRISSFVDDCDWLIVDNKVLFLLTATFPLFNCSDVQSSCPVPTPKGILLHGGATRYLDEMDNEFNSSCGCFNSNGRGTKPCLDLGIIDRRDFSSCNRTQLISNDRRLPLLNAECLGTSLALTPITKLGE